MNFIQHLLAALATAFAMSLAFWFFFDIFDLRGFFAVSGACALVGALAGYYPKNRITITVSVTAVVRFLALFAAEGLPPY